MRDQQHTGSRMNRRKVLKYGALGSAFALGGIQPGAASSAGSDGDIDIEPIEIHVDAGHLPEVEEATFRLKENGSVNKFVRLDPEAIDSAGRTKRRGATTQSENPTHTSYSIDVDIPLEERPKQGAVALDTEEITASVSKRQRELEKAPAEKQGVTDEPFTHGHDYTFYAQTESQECGPLARTNLWADLASSRWSSYLTNTSAGRDTTDGDACQGEEWDSKFESLCDVARFLPLTNCYVPNTFDTTWRTLVDDDGYSSASTVFTCGDFPVLPETVVSMQYVDGNRNGTIDAGVEHAIAPYREVRDYGLDKNGIANVVVDGLTMPFPTEPISWVLARWFLDDHFDVISM